MKGKHLKKISWTKKRMISAILSVSLLLGCIYSASMAWLTDDDQPIVNIFQSNTLEITFGYDDQEFLLVPGATYRLPSNKVPKVVLPANSVDCYLFLVVESYFYDLANAEAVMGTGYILKDSIVGVSFDEKSVPIKQMEGGEYLNTKTSDVDGDAGYMKDGLKLANGTNQFVLKDLLAIKDDSGKIIGQRTIYKFIPYDCNNDDNPALLTSSEEREFYILAGGSEDCKFEVNELLTKEEVHPSKIQDIDKCPKMRFTAFAVQQNESDQSKATNVNAYNAIASAICKEVKGSGIYTGDIAYSYELIPNAEDHITIQ